MPSRLFFHRSLISLAIASGVAASTPALAQNTELAPLTVYSDTYRNTATKTALKPEETPQSISVLDRQALAMRDADTVATALRYAPGVNTELRGGAVGRLDLFTIRGFENLHNYYDGLPLLYLDGWNLQAQTDLHAVEQVEIFRGPTSTLYGAMPPGGMVNMIAKSPSQASFNQVELSTGSHNLKEASLESRGQFGNSDFSYSLVALARKKDSQADTAEEERQMIAPSVDWQITDDTLINVNLYYQKDPEQGIYTTLPAAGLFLDNPNGRIDEDTFSGDKNWNTADREVLMAGYKINHAINNNWTFLQNFRYTDAEYLQRNTYSTGLNADQRTMNRAAYLTDESAHSYAVDNQLTGLVRTGAIEHNLLAGIDYQSMDGSVQYSEGGAPSIDLFNPDNNQIDRGTQALTPFGDYDIDREQLGVYLQDQARIGSWILMAGLRWDDYSGRQQEALYGSDNKQEDTNLSSRAGVMYEFSNGVSPYVNYAESFEPILNTDMFGEPFEISTAKQYEAGVKFRTNTGMTSVDAAVFRIDKKNVPTRAPNAGPYDQIQVGEVRSRGFELEASTQPIDNLLLSLAYTYQDVETSEAPTDIEGNSVVWAPDQLVSAWADYGFVAGPLAGLTSDVGIRYIGEAALTSTGSRKVPDATLFDLAMSYDLGQLSQSMDGAELGLSVNNLLDERYYTCYDAGNCWFGQERTVEASVSYRF
ncbi:TonB-dependent siderophore receptor [Marinobacter zhanjiangensis]|nr:TonB-dependent siderophore receptor [Marinobacter zhanjiangensis]